MDIRITPRPLAGSIEAIASKSYAHRALIAAALCDSPTRIFLNRRSKDIDATIAALSALGSPITVDADYITVFPMGKVSNPVVFCSESGTTARMLLPIAAALYESAVFTGEGSLLSRPFAILCDAMTANGCHFDSNMLPISYRGKLNSGTYEISGSESSQYISGLLFALPLLGGCSRLLLTSPLQSAGYVDMTLDVLRRFGISGGYESAGDEVYSSPGDLVVEGDWSNAAFWLAAGVDVTGLNADSCQKDKLFLPLSQSLEVDAGDVPDLVPILAVAAAGRQGSVSICNASRLKIKESNRLESVMQLLTSLGGDSEMLADGLVIHGRGSLRGGVVDSFNDHRVVMAAAIASTFCEGTVVIKNAEAVEKSYPTFFDDFRKLGGIADVL